MVTGEGRTVGEPQRGAGELAVGSTTLHFFFFFFFGAFVFLFV